MPNSEKVYGQGDGFCSDFNNQQIWFDEAFPLEDFDTRPCVVVIYHLVWTDGGYDYSKKGIGYF